MEKVKLALEKKYISPEENLQQEEQSELKHEYISGEILAMAGGVPNHNKTAANLCATILFGLKRQPYQVFIVDRRQWVPEIGVYTYPDVMVVAGDLELQSGRRDTITNPVLIAEVLTESTQAYDRSEKYNFYRSIPSFKEYLLISQDRIDVEHFSKENVSNEERRWICQNYNQLESEIKLSSIPLSKNPSDLYGKIFERGI
jgi:Uma2 family endonuclease